eukprot:scaffold46143_cov26-Tisochrysis_lutea.AAC.8
MSASARIRAQRSCSNLTTRALSSAPKGGVGSASSSSSSASICGSVKGSAPATESEGEPPSETGPAASPAGVPSSVFWRLVAAAPDVVAAQEPSSCKLGLMGVVRVDGGGSSSETTGAAFGFLAASGAREVPPLSAASSATRSE